MLQKIVSQISSICNVVEFDNSIFDIIQPSAHHKITSHGFISGTKFINLSKIVDIYFPRKIKRLFIKQGDHLLYFDTHEIIDRFDRNNKVIYNLSEYLMEGEELIDIYSFSGPLFFLTNYGRILYEIKEQYVTMDKKIFKVLKDENGKTIIVNQWGPVNFELTCFYFTTKEDILYKVKKFNEFLLSTQFTIKRITKVKDKIKKIKILDSKGICAFKTLKGDWLIYSKSMINSPSYLQNCNFTKLNVKEIILQNEFFKLFNYNLNCIDLFLYFGEIVFLMEDFTFFRAINKSGKEFQRFDIEMLFEDNYIPFLGGGGQLMSSFRSLEFKFAPKNSGFIVWWEKIEIITKELISFQKLLKNNLNNLNFIDILIQFN